MQTLTSSGAFIANDVILQTVSNYQGFGGVGDSGYGRHGSYEGFKQFSNRKGILIKGATPEFLNNLLAPPFTDGKISFVKKITFLINYN